MALLFNMAIFAIADLHLAYGVPEKTMEIFGNPWINYQAKIKRHWEELVTAEDLVLLPGDISWALKLVDTKADFDFIHALPGTKVMIRGNHDLWWNSIKQIEAILPSSISIVQNNSFTWKNFVIGGTRLWDSSEYKFNHLINYVPPIKEKKAPALPVSKEEVEKIFIRELNRLHLSLKEMEKRPGRRIIMTHYPPISATLEDSRVSLLLEKYQVEQCVFGHLHNLKKDAPLFGKKNGVHYNCVSADYLDFTPLRLTC